MNKRPKLSKKLRTIVSQKIVVQKMMAEQATGLAQNGSLGSFYLVSGDDNPSPLSDEEARTYLEGTCFIAVPNAGAGSYREFFERVGFKDVKPIDRSSSAGDWCFGVQRSDGVWILAFQENRYPRHGFTYSIQPQYQASSMEVLENTIQG